MPKCNKVGCRSKERLELQEITYEGNGVAYMVLVCPKCGETENYTGSSSIAYKNGKVCLAFAVTSHSYHGSPMETLYLPMTADASLEPVSEWCL